MDSYDVLAAARDSAYWAGAAAVAAWFALFLNGGGIALLWRQLKISEDAALAARDAVRIAAAETRPWIQAVVRKADGAVTNRDTTLRTVAIVDLVNVGKTPATKISTFSRVLVQPTPREIREAFDALRNRTDVSHRILFPGETTNTYNWTQETVAAEDWHGRRDVFIALLVRYSSGAADHETPMLLNVWPKDDDLAMIGGWELRERTLSELDHSHATLAPLSPT